MRSLPGSLDGSQGTVLDESGRQVASFATDDQRRKAADPVYVFFEERNPAWEDRLVTEAGHGLRVSLVWMSGDRLDGVQVLDAFVPRARDLLTTVLDDPEIGIDRDDLRIQFIEDEQPSSLNAVEFRIDHPDL
jgi:hypothetical protein